MQSSLIGFCRVLDDADNYWWLRIKRFSLLETSYGYSTQLRDQDNNIVASFYGSTPVEALNLLTQEVGKLFQLGESSTEVKILRTQDAYVYHLDCKSPILEPFYH